MAMIEKYIQCTGNDWIIIVSLLHRCQPSRNRAGNPANLVVSRIPAFFPKHPAFLGFFGGEKNRQNSR